MFQTKRARPRTVLFLCRVNGGRSIMAEALTNARSSGSFLAFSAGVDPVDRIPRPVLEILQQNGVPTDGLRPKLWREFAGIGGRPLDFVITTCDTKASEVCQHWPGQPISAHWHIDDPAEGVSSPEELMDNLQKTFLLIERLVDLFVCLPPPARDRMSLRHPEPGFA